MTGPKYVLRTKDLSKEFKSFTALNDVTIELESGRCYGLIGKNGAGKTTLMKIITGLAIATSGSLELFGETDAEGIRLGRRKIGSLIEEPGLNRSMTAVQNLRMHRYIRGIPNKEVEEELLEMVGLSNVRRKRVGDFSLGMRQRLGIAIALLSNPDLLILDEPVNGLDPIGVVQIRDLIKRLCEERNITVLISSHNLPELHQTASDYILIDAGEVKQTLTGAELDEACQQYISITTRDTQKLTAVLQMEVAPQNFRVMPDGAVRVFDSQLEHERVFQSLFANDIVPTRFESGGKTLESYFLNAIKG